MVGAYLQNRNQIELVKKYDLKPFNLNVLDKKKTFVEKIVSLIRFSFANDYINSIASKARHFYDLYFLTKDGGIKSYIDSDNFIADFVDLVKHDQEAFDDPAGWRSKMIAQSPLITNFNGIWNKIKAAYIKDLSNIVFTDLPD